MKDETLESLFNRTLNNCIYYEKAGKTERLLNEIGVLRGISYVFDLVGLCPHTPEFMHFIHIQNKLLKDK